MSSSRNPRDQRSMPSSRPAARRGGYDARYGGYDQGPSQGAAPERRRGPHLGPIAITPLRVMLLVAFLGGVGFLAYSLLTRDVLQVPLMATGFAICGIVFGLMALISVVSVIRAGHERRDATAVIAALGGGALAVASMLCLAAAAIFSMIWSGTKAG